MARSPFQGTWQQGIRPTVVTAPDAVVYINGEADIIGCPQCARRFPFNRYMTSVQVDLSVDSPPGSASFNLSIPRHTIDDFYFDGEPLIAPMMEIEIYAKGYYLIEGLPQYYPIFWGLTTEISDSYSGGEHTVSVNCSDILKWWELCKMNINPAFTQAVGQKGRNLFGNVFSGTNPYDVIWSLAHHSFGDIVVGSGSLLSMYKEKGAQKKVFTAAMGDVMRYWSERFASIRSNLLLYGTRGNAIRGDIIQETIKRTPGLKGHIYSPDSPQRQPVSQMVRQANGGKDGSQMVFDPTDSQVTAFRTQFMNAGQVNFWQSEYQTKLELANAAKECIGFEFFMDVTGDIVFKPPFYNLDVLSNKPVSWIQDIDIIDWDLSESEAEVVTQLQIQGAFGGNVDFGFGEEMTPATSVTDYHLLRRYGWRTQVFNSEFMGSTIHMFYMGMDLLDRYNAKRFRGSISIPLRPELRLGFPIYLGPKDQVWYVNGISHNIAFGGRAQTTLSLTAKRTKFVAPRGIGKIRMSDYKGNAPPPGAFGGGVLSARQLAKSASFVADIGEAAQIPPDQIPEPGKNSPYAPLILRHPKTGRIVGYPNVVMAYTRPFQVPPSSFKAAAGQRDRKKKGRGAKPTVTKELNDPANKALEKAAEDLNQYSARDAIRDKYLSNRFAYGLTSAGVYTYLHDESQVIKEMLLIQKNRVQFAEDDPKYLEAHQTGMMRPVSDERGFEVIGHYKYGRGISLQDGSLVLNETAEKPGALNSLANINTQSAISGELFETLASQSQGLVDLSLGGTKRANPAHAVSTLDPVDLQTAGVWDPETKKAEFVNTDTSFVDVAPLGSPEQEGASTKDIVSVEASQLSRALTLAEMKVAPHLGSESIDEACGCLLSRSDLAFINIGYQTKVLRATGSDNSAQGQGSVTDAGKIAGSDEDTYDTPWRLAAAAIDVAVKTARDEAQDEAQERVSAGTLKFGDIPGYVIFKEDEAEAQARNEQAQLHGFDSGASAEFDTWLAEGNQEQEALEEYWAKFGQIDEDGNPLPFPDYPPPGGTEEEAAEGPDFGTPDYRPVDSGSRFLSREQAVSRVETFLANLYKILDTPHQEYEKILRGEFVESPVGTSADIRFGEGFAGPSNQGGFVPPFSTPGRPRGGDLDDIAEQGSTAASDLAEAWNSFADDLNANVERAALAGEVNRLQKRVTELRAEIEEREKALTKGSVIVTTQGSGLDDLRHALSQAEEELANAEHALKVFNQEHPP